VPILDPLPITVSRPMILLRLGYRRPAQVPEKTALLIAEVMEKGSVLLHPRAVYEELEVEEDRESGSIRIGPAGGPALVAASRSLHERIAGCRRAVLFAATVGPEVETWARDLMDAGEMTRGLLADAFGSAAAIALGLAVEQVVEKRFAGSGLSPTKRYAPGYGDWALSDQEPLVALSGAARIGITLNEEHLMHPSKTISGVIGGRPSPAAPVSS
jgi:hypothetical protein